MFCASLMHFIWDSPTPVWDSSGLTTLLVPVFTPGPPAWELHIQPDVEDPHGVRQRPHSQIVDTGAGVGRRGPQR